MDRHVADSVRLQLTKPRGDRMSPGLALFSSVILLALNGFFVAAEFALVASKRTAWSRRRRTVAGRPGPRWTASASCR